jgi:HEAT repeat protein
VYAERTPQEIESFLDDRASVKRNLAYVLRLLLDWMKKDREAAVRAVLRRLDSPDRRTVEDTLATVALLEIPEAAPDLESLLGGPSSDRAKLLAAAALARVGDARNVPLLEKMRSGPGAGPADEIAAWVRRLGSEDWAERERAQAALRKIGNAAVPLLEEALRGDDLEVRVRARDLLDGMRREEDAGLGPLLQRALERGIRDLRERK